MFREKMGTEVLPSLASFGNWQNVFSYSCARVAVSSVHIHEHLLAIIACTAVVILAGESVREWSASCHEGDCSVTGFTIVRMGKTKLLERTVQ